MRETRPINASGNPSFRYHKHTDVGETFRRVRRQLEQAWIDAHSENSERDKAANVNVRQIKEGTR